MMMLWIAIAALLLIAVIILCLPLIMRQQNVRIHDTEENVAIFKDRLSELEQERHLGVLDDNSFEQLKLELEKSLLTDVEDDDPQILSSVEIKPKHWFISLSIASILIITSLAIYSQLGRSEDYALYLTMKEQGQLEQAENSNTPSLEKVIALLEKKLESDPKNLEKLFLLANSYRAIGEYNKAAHTYAKALEIIPADDPSLATAKGAYAQALFQAAGEKITPEVDKIMKETLALDPLESSALILAGIQAFTQNDIPQAIKHWENAKAKASEHDIAGFLDPVIQQAKARLGITETAKENTTSKTDDSNSGASITIKLEIAPELKTKVTPEQFVFVFARPHDQKMPLAVQKLQVKDLPTSIVLDDSKSPMPTAKLSSVNTVDIIARVSQSGHVTPKKGDFFTTQENVAVKNNSETLEMTINQIMQ